MYKLFFAFCLLLLQVNAFGQKTHLFKVTAPNNGPESYILGSFPQTGGSFIDDHPVIKEKLFQSDVTIFLLLSQPGKLREIISQREPSSDLEKNLSKSELKVISRMAGPWQPLLTKVYPLELFHLIRNEYYLTKCGGVKPNEKWEDFDLYLDSLARVNRKEVISLENDSLQIALLKAESPTPDWEKWKEGIKFWLKKYQEKVPDPKYCNLNYRYLNLEIDYEFGRVCTKEQENKERKAGWMPRLTHTLASRKSFVSFPLGLLTGNCGLLEELKRQGYKVEPVAM
ncbi:MAG: TraB/GumN family protein [Rufibacter sp.]